MRLLNAHNLELVNFIGRDIPEYSISSHTWEREEVTFEHLAGKGSNDFRRKLGFSKVEGCLLQTLEDRYEWIWVDTCCINKSNSAEFPEIIHSMYTWYHRAAICYTYLADVTTLSGDDDNPQALDLENLRFGEVAGLPLTIRQHPNASPLGTRCRGISSFMVPLPTTTLPSVKLTTPYLRDADTNETSNSQFNNTIDWRRLDEHGYKLAHYFPSNKFHPAYPYRGFFHSSDGINLLLRFRHKHIDDLLLLYCCNVDVLPISDAPQILGECAAMAIAFNGPRQKIRQKSHPTTTWELLLQPDFDEVDFERLEKPFQWNSAANVVSDNDLDDRFSLDHAPFSPTSERMVQFTLRKGADGEGARIFSVKFSTN
ncbi:hypothetical protein F5Y06DRAFT_295774 [Hypoxylon sp. FL0890]|nr:hypothetical protein F5Y06DRAFT_295774 [Hypoxylon sp. FL0890]